MEIFTARSFRPLRHALQKRRVRKWKNNDYIQRPPEVVAQLRDEVMSLRNLLTEQRSENNAKAVDTHVPMSVEEAAEYLGIPQGNTLHEAVGGKHSCH